jgi:DinB family protein
MARALASEHSSTERGRERQPFDMPANKQRHLLLAILDQAYNRRSWHGTNLRGSLRGLSARQAAWRPAPARHNIWELAVHAAYWKYAVRRRLTGEARGSFSLKGSNWFRRPIDTSQQAWPEDLALLDATHRSLRNVVADFPITRLLQRVAGSNETGFSLIAGAAAHDLYHAGQIQLLKRLMTTQIRE